ncbi:MAG: hypothetical protein HXK83_09540, partial [Lachnospiraceae bacterium]|nr:hypothetical protein [Lachnospiraceae bacterium]
MNTVEAFAGINASGKTTALKVVTFTNFLLGAAPLSANFVPQILDENGHAIIDIDFFSDKKIFHLTSEICRTKKEDGSNSVKILAEKLWRKPVTSKINKTNLFAFDGITPVRVRDQTDEYLPDDVSIMIAVDSVNNLSQIYFQPPAYHR